MCSYFPVFLRRFDLLRADLTSSKIGLHFKTSCLPLYKCDDPITSRVFVIFINYYLSLEEEILRFHDVLKPSRRSMNIWDNTIKT